MPKHWSEEYHGIDYARPVARMRDYVAAIRRAWEAAPGAPVDYEGDFYRFTGYAPLAPPTRHPIPITIGSIRRRMSRLAGEIADGVVLDSMCTPAWARDVLWPEFERGFAAAGRGPRVLRGRLRRHLRPRSGPERARDWARRTIAFYLITPYLRDVLEHHGLAAAYDRGKSHLARGDVEAAARELPDEIVEEMAIVATDPAELQEALRRYEGIVDWVRLSPPHANPIPVIVAQAKGLIEAVRPGS